MRRDGAVEMIRVKVNQRKRAKRQGRPTVRQAEDYFMARGFSRTMPKPTQRVTMVDVVRRAFAAA